MGIFAPKQVYTCVMIDPEIVMNSMTTNVYVLILILLATSCSSKRENHAPKSNPSLSGAHLLPLLQDSGFVLKKDGLPFLLSNRLTDTTDASWNHLNDNDTIAKYYRINQTGHFYYCTVDLSKKYTYETHLLLELTPDAKIIKSARYFHSHYSCCWGSYCDGFNRYGDFFGIKTCATGSGFCASNLYLFKTLVQQDEQSLIPLGYLEAIGVERRPQRVSSTLEIKRNELIMHYLTEVGDLDEQGNFKVKKTKKMNATFIFRNNQWVCRDSAILAKFDLLLSVAED
jgi:hypothetical protein